MIYAIVVNILAADKLPAAEMTLRCLAIIIFGSHSLMMFGCRCVLNWFGDWSTGALYQVGKEFTNKIDLEKTNVIVHRFYSLRDYVFRVL